MMHIPEKYRDRYDRLARSHPWMREMRDETNGIDGETNGIGADAPLVDVLDLMREASGEMHAVDYVRLTLRAYDTSDMFAKLADMVEWDYVSREKWTEAMRAMKAAQDAMERATDERDDALEQWEQWSKLATDIIALFYPVEEEGLPNDAYNVVNDFVSKLTAERDELQKKVDEQQETLDNDCRDLIENDNEICKLTAERDEWKRKAEQAESAMNAAAGKWAKADEESRELRKMLLLDDGTVEEYTERADPMTALAHQKQLAEEWRDRCHNAEAWCDKLESERDEWKAKAEAKSAKHAAAVERLRKMQHVDDYGDWVEAIAEVVKGTDKSNIGDYGMWESLIVLLTDDDGVARSTSNLEQLFIDSEQFRQAVSAFAFAYADDCPTSPTAMVDWLMTANGGLRSNDRVTNLEWLWEHDKEGLECFECCTSRLDEDCNSIHCCGGWSVCNEYDNTCGSMTKIEWLMAPHDDAHSKAQSKTEPSLSEQSESLSDEKPHETHDFAGFSQKSPELGRENDVNDCVRNDGEMSENDVSANAVDANDENVTCNKSGENVTHDSREKINALRAHYGAGPTAMTDEQIAAGREVYGASKDVDMVIVDELHDSREKLEADASELVADYAASGDVCDALHRGIIALLDRQAEIIERECREYEDAMREQHRKRVAILRANLEDAEHDREALDYYSERYAEMDGQITELAAERNYWKQQMQLCMDSAYPPSHSPERAYNLDVMAYPDRNGCTTPSTLVADVMDGLRDKLAAVAKAVMS